MQTMLYWLKYEWISFEYAAKSLSDCGYHELLDDMLDCCHLESVVAPYALTLNCYQTRLFGPAFVGLVA